MGSAGLGSNLISSPGLGQSGPVEPAKEVPALGPRGPSALARSVCGVTATPFHLVVPEGLTQLEPLEPPNLLVNQLPYAT